VYIDFHIHAFADKIAERAIGTLRQNLRDGGLDDTVYGNGSYSDTERIFSDSNDVGYSGVFMPISTKLSQMNICNNVAAAKNNYIITENTRFWSYGSVFPLTETAEELAAVLSELERIKALGLYGIKLHPDYQNFFIDDERVFPVYEKCAELSIPIMFHAGFDPVSPKLTHATPDRALRVIENFPKLTLILAHMGGEYYWDDVEKLIAGKNCYIDTSYCAENMDSALMERMIKNHGAEKVLFGSDFPWKSPADIRHKIDSLNLSEREKSDIYYKNAYRLLGINFN
jgi:predicted TIM-barrel fold metal-dependent hydrolase